MLFSIDVVFTVVAIVFGLVFLGAFTAASATRLLNLGGLANLATKFLGYKELFDIATGNNKSDYGDLFDNVANGLLGNKGK